MECVEAKAEAERCSASAVVEEVSVCELGLTGLAEENFLVVFFRAQTAQHKRLDAGANNHTETETQ